MRLAHSKTKADVSNHLAKRAKAARLVSAVLYAIRNAHPPRVCNILKQHEALLKSIDRRVFPQHLIVFRHGRNKDQDVHILKAVDPIDCMISGSRHGPRCPCAALLDDYSPLFALAALTADVKDAYLIALNFEALLHDARRAHASAQNVLIRRHVVERANAGDVVEEAVGENADVCQRQQG